MSELVGVARFSFRGGDVEAFKRLSAEAMEIVRAKDSGTLQYDIHLSDDESAAVVIERYRDSDALTEHVANLGDLLGKLMATGKVEGEVLGHVSPELRAQLTANSVRVFNPFLSK